MRRIIVLFFAHDVGGQAVVDFAERFLAATTSRRKQLGEIGPQDILDFQFGSEGSWQQFFKTSVMPSQDSLLRLSKYSTTDMTLFEIALAFQSFSKVVVLVNVW